MGPVLAEGKARMGHGEYRTFRKLLVVESSYKSMGTVGVSGHGMMAIGRTQSEIRQEFGGILENLDSVLRTEDKP